MQSTGLLTVTVTLLLQQAALLPAAALVARVNPASNTGPCTVLELDQTSVPAATTWFRLRTAEGYDFPTPIMPVGPDWKASDGLWFVRTLPKSPGLAPQGIQQFPFMATGMFNAGEVAKIVPCNLSGSPTNMSFVVEAWSDRNDLGDGNNASLLASSAAMAFVFDDLGFSQSLKFDSFAVANSVRVPGLMTITAQPNNVTAYAMAKLVTWYGFTPIPTAPTSERMTELRDGVANTVTFPSFTLNSQSLGDQYTTREFPIPTANVSYSGPGVHFVGIYGAWNGEYGYSSPTPNNGVRTYNSFPLDNITGTHFQPLAIIVPFENGTHPALPTNFAGPVYVAPSIPGDWRLALRVDSITVFHGGTVSLPCVHGPAYPNGAAFAPDVIEVEVPVGLILVPPPACVAAGCGGVGYENITDVSQVAGGGAVASGYKRFRLEKLAAAEWSYLNGAIELKTAVAPGSESALEGNTFTASRIRAYSGDTNQQRGDNWQPLAITVSKLTPVASLPTRLHTAYCWSQWNEFIDRTDLNLDSITTWRSLGFNTIPSDGASYAVPPTKPSGMLNPANRTGSKWVGLKYGIMTSPFGTAGFSAPPYGLGSFSALKLKNISAADGDKPPNGFNFSAIGMTPSEEAAERKMWKQALVFFNETGVMDIAYDGFFKHNDFATVTKLAQYSQPDYVSMDIESFPSLAAYVNVGYKSANFATGKQSHETDSEASLRFAASWLGGVVAAMKKAVPHAKPYLYGIPAVFDEGFQITSWPVAKALGFADMPSYYGLQNGLDVLAATIRRERLAVGTQSELIPWLTPGATGGTGGAQTADPGTAMYNVLIQAFANGATGFNVYTTEGMYDMALWLAMRDAIAIVTPHEDVVCDGAPIESDMFTAVAATAVVSGMQSAKGDAVLIASSTIPHGLPTAFTVRATHADDTWVLCDCKTLKSSPVSASGFVQWTSEREMGTVLLMAKITPCHPTATSPQ
eukprot:m.161880 g.161880  ORF g.161880 m.161880 type:complete len:971 (-) comp31257_c0_seq1:282-3194(-)